MGKLSYRKLYKKFGLIISIAVSLFGLFMLFSFSNLNVILAKYIDKQYREYFYLFAGGFVRIICFFLMFDIAFIMNVDRKLGLGFKRFGRALSMSCFGYGVSAAFLLDAIVMNRLIGNEFDVWLMAGEIVLCFGTGLFEEIMSRGIVMHVLKVKFKNKLLIVLLQAIIFMLLHSSNYFTGVLSFDELKIQFAYTFIFGFYYGYIYLRTNSLPACVLFHFVYDFCVSSPMCFKPTGEYGVLYSGMDKLVLICSVLFTIIFICLNLIVLMIKSYVSYKEETA